MNPAGEGDTCPREEVFYGSVFVSLRVALTELHRIEEVEVGIARNPFADAAECGYSGHRPRSDEREAFFLGARAAQHTQPFVAGKRPDLSRWQRGAGRNRRREQT